MNVTLVTGATGFVGSACVRRLAATGEVHASARTPSAELPAAAVFHAADLLERGAAADLIEHVRPTRLLHLAWIATPDTYRDSDENDAWLGASRALFDAFARNGGRRFVGVGTCAEYDWSSAGPLRENESATRPLTKYARAKDALRAWLERESAGRGVNAVWARLFFLYGPREHPARLVPSVANALLEGRTAACTAGTQVRDFLHVDDAAAALVALLDADVEGPVNVASGEGATVRSVAERIEAAVGGGDLRLGERPTPAWEPASIVADVTRLRSEVGWTPARTLDRGIVETVEWWRTHARAA